MSKRRTKEERIADIDAKIEQHNKHIDTLNQKKQDILNKTSVRRKSPKTEILDAIKNNEIDAAEIIAFIKSKQIK